MNAITQTTITLQIPAMPLAGQHISVGNHVIYTNQDDCAATARMIELTDLTQRQQQRIHDMMQRLAEAEECSATQSAVSSEELVKARARAELFKISLAELKQEFKVIETKARKAEALAAQETQRAEKKSDRVQKLQKEVKQLTGQISMLTKQIEDQKKRFKREYIDESKPTAQVGGGRIVVQLHGDQIHVHDPACCYLISSQPLPDESDFAPVFKGYPFEAMLDQHKDLKEAIEHAINGLAKDWRKAKEKVLVADLDEKPQLLRKVWDSGFIFAADLRGQLDKVAALPGIGSASIKRLELALNKAGL